MFKLHVLNFNSFINDLSLNVTDLFEGLRKYNDLANTMGIDIVYHENVSSKELIKSGVQVDGILNYWGNGLNDNSKSIKKAILITDIHWWYLSQLQMRLKLFKEHDLIFTPYYRTTIAYDVFKEFKNKFVSLFWWLPERMIDFNIQWNQKKHNILFSGADSKFYKLRQIIKASPHSLLEILPHSGYNTGRKEDYNNGKYLHKYHGKNFLEYIATFKGMIATTASGGSPGYDPKIKHPLDYTLKKVYESLGMGCLGFLEKTKDFNELGLIEYENYIPINYDNFNSQFNWLNNPKAELIAWNGKQLIAENHTTKQRVLKVLNAVKEKWL